VRRRPRGCPRATSGSPGGRKGSVIPSKEKAGSGKPIQIQDTKQLKRLHKDGRFLDLKPEHMLKQKKPLSAIRAASDGAEPEAGAGAPEGPGGGATADMEPAQAQDNIKRDRVEDRAIKHMLKKKQRLYNFGNDIEAR
jgi:hypothetical protein